MIYTRKRASEDITEVSLEVQFAALLPISNELLLQDPETTRKLLQEAKQMLLPKLLDFVKKWVDGE